MEDNLLNVTAPRPHRGRGIVAGAPLVRIRGHRRRGIGLRGTVGGHGQVERHENEARPPPGGCRGPQQQTEPMWIWIDTFPGGNYSPINIPFQGQPGLRVALQDNPIPIDYFTLYLQMQL